MADEAKDAGAQRLEIAVARAMEPVLGTLTDIRRDLKEQKPRDGLSVYELAVHRGFTGSQDDWFASLKGDRGDRGEQGLTGRDGKDVDLDVLRTVVQRAIDEMPKPKDGTRGPRGLRGETGEKGETGQRGAKGDRGNAMFHGEGPPMPTTGILGDFYIETQANLPLRAYGPKTEDGWGLGVRMRGIDGGGGGSTIIQGGGGGGGSGTVTSVNGDVGPAVVLDAAEIPFTPAGALSADDVQEALEELDTEKQPKDATLTSLAALGTAADKIAYTTGIDTWAETALTAFIRTLLDDANAGTARTTLGLGTVATLDSDTDTALAANSDARVATQKAVKAYVDAILEAQDVLQFKGGIDCSANPNYPAANKGHFYKVTVAGKIGGASGANVESGDSMYCITDASAGGTQAAVGADWVIVQVNLDGAVIGPSSATDGNLAAFDGVTGKLIKELTPAQVRTLLGLVIGANVQAYDADLAAIAGLTSAADKGIYFTGSGTAGTFDLSAFARSLLDDADAATMRTTLGLVIGTNVQAYDAELAALAGLVSAADKVPYFTGSGAAALADLSSFIRTLLDDTTAAAARTTLGFNPITKGITASEDLSAGNFVNVWNDAGTAKVRKTNATSSGKYADGFVLAAVSSGNSATVYFSGINDQCSGLTPGRQFLSTTGGLTSHNAPTGTQQVVQQVGTAVSATEIAFNPLMPVVLD